MNASQLIRAARVRAQLTQAELAKRAGMSQSTIARLERPGANPTVRVLERALRAAGASLTLAPGSQVDESQLVERLNLTPAQRLAAFQTSHRNLGRLVAGARRVGAAT